MTFMNFLCICAIDLCSKIFSVAFFSVYMCLQICKWEKSQKVPRFRTSTAMVPQGTTPKLLVNKLLSTVVQCCQQAFKPVGTENAPTLLDNAINTMDGIAFAHDSAGDEFANDMLSKVCATMTDRFKSWKEQEIDVRQTQHRCLHQDGGFNCPTGGMSKR